MNTKYQRKYYQKNKERFKKNQREYYYSHKEERREYYNSHKEERQAYSRKYHNENKEKRRIQNRQYQQQVKEGILTHYGNGKCGCVKCGESRLACLSIDHIKAIGAKRRRKGVYFYRWLEINNYPKGYQTLCMNCQWVKRVENNEVRNGL